jgi:hypothetical protein
LCLGALALPAHAQSPKAKARAEAREARKEAAKEAREAREDAREARAEAREARAEARDKLRELREKARKGELTEADKDELKKMRGDLREKHKAAIDAWRDYRGKAAERRRAARREVAVRWATLHGRPAVRAELRVHARRMARLRHAEHVAKTNDRDELAARIQKLTDRERARHERHMESLKAKGGEE